MIYNWYLGAEEIVDLLLNAGANVSYKQPNGWTGLKFLISFYPK